MKKLFFSPEKQRDGRENEKVSLMCHWSSVGEKRGRRDNIQKTVNEKFPDLLKAQTLR